MQDGQAVGPGGADLERCVPSSVWCKHRGPLHGTFGHPLVRTTQQHSVWPVLSQYWVHGNGLCSAQHSARYNVQCRVWYRVQYVLHHNVQCGVQSTVRFYSTVDSTI
jgi:hypothetical protein